MNTILKPNWSSSKYSIGSFIQMTFANHLLQDFKFNPDDICLDIGCGDGSYTLHLAEQLPNGKITAIDYSGNMIELAKSRNPKYNNVTFIQQDASSINYSNKFSVITAFWSLQWVPDFNKVLNNIYNALINNGRLFIVYPSENCLYMQLFHMVKASGQFKVLDNFNVPARFMPIDTINNWGSKLGFKQFQCTVEPHSLLLPDLETLRKFINGIGGFYQGQIADNDIPAINEAMVECFTQICSPNIYNNYILTDELVVIKATK